MKEKVLFAILLCGAVHSFSAENFGKYKGSVQVSWDIDSERMTLLEDFTYVDPNDMEWTAKKGQKTDGATIPRWLWSVVGSPYNGSYRDAAVIHDIACGEKKRTWEVSHLAFYYAMRASGVSEVRAKTMYAAVYHFGPRWQLAKRIQVAAEYTRTETVPATYRNVIERVLVAPAYKDWKKASEVTVTNSSETKRDPVSGELLVLTEVPAVYRVISVQVVERPAYTREVTVPAVYETVKASYQPSSQEMTQSRFEQLVRRLSSSGQESLSMTLEEIRSFK